jgi:hypothetical protein
MKIHFGAPPQDPDFHPERDGWTKLREPDPIFLQIIATPVAILNLAILLAAWFALAWFQPRSMPIFDWTGNSNPWPALISSFSLSSIIVGIPMLITAHELTHAIGYPGSLRTDQTLIGIWPAKFLFYASHSGSVSRNRFLVVSILPLLALTVLPLVGSALSQHIHIGLAAMSIVNGTFACGDQVVAAIVAWQVPRKAIVRNQGWQTWWKVPDYH